METIIGADAVRQEFTLLADLGTITIPGDSVPGEQLDTFRLQNCRLPNLHLNVGITDNNFPYPARILMPGESFRVRAFMQVGRDKTTTNERLAFLDTQNAIHTAQGMAYVFEQKREELPVGYRYILFHQEVASGDALLIHSAFSLGCFGSFSLEPYTTDNRWRWDEAMLCISPLE